MSIMDIFRTKPPAGQTTAQTPAPGATNVDPSGNATVPGAKTTVNDGTTPTPGAFPKAGEGEKSPLENYGKLWETDPNAKPIPSGVPTFNVDPKKLMDAARGVDFTKAIPPETLEKASKGDVIALSEAINLSAQAGYAQSAAATTKIVQQALTEQAKVFKESIMPAILREHTVSQTLSNDVLLNNPAVKPMVDAAKIQIAAKYPNASPDEIAKHTNEYFGQFAQELVKAQGFTLAKAGDANTQSPTGAAKQEDWGKFFNFQPET